MTDKSKVVGTAVLAGLVLGAAAWYLFGTEKGKKTSNKLVDSLKCASDSIKDFRNKAADTIDQLSGHADKLAGKAEKLAGNVKSETSRAYKASVN